MSLSMNPEAEISVLSLPLLESLIFLLRRVNRKSSWPLWTGSATSFGGSAEPVCEVSGQVGAAHLAASRETSSWGNPC